VSGVRTSRHTDVVSDTDVRSTPELVGDESTDVDRPWVVIVWNDPINLMSYVTFVLQKVFGYDK
jgi:ATP-dependent Clp protease adapter protein ClpS